MGVSSPGQLPLETYLSVGLFCKKGSGDDRWGGGGWGVGGGGGSVKKENPLKGDDVN